MRMSFKLDLALGIVIGMFLMWATIRDWTCRHVGRMLEMGDQLTENRYETAVHHRRSGTGQCDP